MQFISPTKGPMDFDRMFGDILQYLSEQPKAAYRLIIGTDSHEREGNCFVTAVIVHRMGKGARYYYTKFKEPHVESLRQRIFYEASLSLHVASKIMERLARERAHKVDVEIHLDVGTNGKTKGLIRDVVGMVMGSGFDAKIKPDSYGASKVADKHSK